MCYRSRCTKTKCTIAQNDRTFKIMTQLGAYVFPKFQHVYTSIEQMQNCFRAVLKNTHRSFFIKPNPNNCGFETVARRLNLIWKDRNFVFKVH